MILREMEIQISFSFQRSFTATGRTVTRGFFLGLGLVSSRPFSSSSDLGFLSGLLDDRLSLRGKISS